MTIAERMAGPVGPADEQSGSVIALLHHAFDVAVQDVAQRCAPGGALEADLLDRHQWASFELAWVYAELLAAETGLASAAEELDVGLHRAYVADGLRSVLGRLEALYLALNLPMASLDAVRAPVSNLWLEGAGPATLEELGVRIMHSDSEIGAVALDEQTEMARDAFRRFAADVVAPLAEEIHRQDLIVPETLLGPMREMGVFGLSIPERFGGTAVDEHENTPMMIAVTEALSEASLAAAGSLITRPEILARALLAGGSEAQKAFWLPKIAAGSPLCAIAITEPDFGSDAASLSLRAVPTDGGWLLNGAKTWCTFAGKAGLLMVVARTSPDRALGHRGLSVLLVEKPSYEGHDFVFQQSAGGTLSGRAIPTIGYRGMHSFDLTFEDVFVPAANVVGEQEGIGKGFYLTMAGMTGGRIQTAGRALGVMRAALSAACRYARDRKVFGAPLADFSLTRIKIAQMAARFAACRRLAFAVAQQLDEGAGRLEASLVKLLACRSAELITREALQIHGGLGYAEESPVSRYWIDARVLSIFEGAEETLALKVIARGLFEKVLAR